MNKIIKNISFNDIEMPIIEPNEEIITSENNSKSVLVTRKTKELPAEEVSECYLSVLEILTENAKDFNENKKGEVK